MKNRRYQTDGSYIRFSYAGAFYITASKKKIAVFRIKYLHKPLKWHEYGLGTPFYSIG